MKKVIKALIIIGSFSIMLSCNNTNITTNNPSMTTENETIENQTTEAYITTERPNTIDPTQTTTHIPTDSTTEIPTTNEPTTTIETITETPTTEAPTTNIPTTETPTTMTTTEWVTIYFENVSYATFTYDTLSSMPGNAFTFPDDPIWPGYIFEGWFEDESFTIPFNISVYPDEDITVYAKWTEETTLIDEMIIILEDDFNFTCIDNTCTLEESSYMTYTFDLNNITFTKELLDDDTSGDSQTKTETLVINDEWDVEYNISITYLSTQNASMRVTGNAISGSYTVRSFSSNYLSQSDLYDDALQFIDGPYGAGGVGFLEYILQVADMTLSDLAN